MTALSKDQTSPMRLSNGLRGATQTAAAFLPLLIAWTVLGLGIYVALSTVAMVVAAWSPVPFGDQWDNLVSVRHVSWSWLYAQHNEHRILVPRLVFLLDRWLFRETNVADFAANVLAQGTLVLLLVFLSNGHNSQRLTTLPWTLGLALGLLFWAAQYENFIWGFQIAFFLVSLAAASAFTALALLRPTVWALGLVVVLESVAVYTNANGIVVPFLMVPLAMRLGRPRSHVLVLAVFAVGLLASYMVDYHSPTGHSNPAEAWRHVGAVVPYILAELGSPFGTLAGSKKIEVAIGLGVIAVIALGLLGWRLISRREASAPRDLVLLAIACFVFGTVVLTAMGRAERFGLGQAFASRYATPVLLFWFSIIVLASRCFRPDGDGRLLVGMILTIPLLGVVVISQPLFTRGGLHVASERREAIPALLSGVRDLSVLERIYPVPDPEVILEDLPLLRAAHASIFADEWGHWLGTPIEDHVALVDTARCQGEFDLAEIVATTSPRGWRGYGRAEDLSLRKPVEKILFVGRDDKIVGFGINSRELETASGPVSSSTAPHTTWIGSFGDDGAAQVRAYALVDQGHSACSLGLPQQVVANREIELLQVATPLPSWGGFVDSVEIDQHTATISGWGMLSSLRPGQKVDIDTNLSVLSATISRVRRPDVVSDRKDERLVRSGIRVILHLKPDAQIPSHIRLCIVTSDAEYGTHMLQIPSRPELCPAGANP